MRDRILVATIAAGVLVLDQITKFLVATRLPLHDRIPVVDGLLAITHVRNRGAAFGLFADIQSESLRWALIAVSLVAVALIWLYARESWHQPVIVVAFGAILGGAMGNLIDRLWRDGVVDFVLVHWRQYHWPSFNVADAAITMGAIALFLAMARRGEEDDPDPGDAPAAGGVPGATDERQANDLLTPN